VALAVQFDAIPAELAAQPHWYLWNYRAQGGKWKKPPVQIDGTAASVTDLATSTTYALVRDAYNHEPFDGIGVLIEGETVGIDLDHCVASNGDIEPWAAEIAHRFASTYRECSPSSAGLRIFATGRVPRSGKGGPENRLEVYAEGSPRYLTVTGHRLGVATEVTEQQAALDWLFERHMTAKAATKLAPTQGTAVSWRLAANDARSDADILHCLFAAANGADARRLFDGDAGDDPSAADMKLVCLLAFHTRDRAQLDRIFRTSRLWRPKWDEPRGAQTYGEGTIAKALAFVTESCRRCHGGAAGGAAAMLGGAPQTTAGAATLAATALPAANDAGGPAAAAPAAAGGSGSLAALPEATPAAAGAIDFEPLRFLTAGELQRQPPIQWLVQGVLPVGGFGVMHGEPGSGKSFLALNLAAAIALGIPWFGRTTRPGNVLYVSCEGALRNRVAALLQQHQRDDLPSLLLREGSINLRAPDTDTRRVIHAATALGLRHQPVALIIVDTLARALAGGDENGPTDMGLLIGNATRIHSDTGAAVVFIHHCGKDASKGGRGHSSLRGAVDLEIAVMRDRDESQRQFVLSKVKEGEDGAKHGFVLTPVALGPQPAPAGGEQPYSCVVEPAVITGGGGGKHQSKTPAGTMIALRALREALDQYGERMPGTSAIPAGVRAVAGKHWRTRYDALDGLDATADAEAMKRAVEARKKRFTRARLRLQEAQRVGSINDLYWLTD
jgi:hypothetical protein